MGGIIDTMREKKSKKTLTVIALDPSASSKLIKHVAQSTVSQYGVECTYIEQFKEDMWSDVVKDSFFIVLCHSYSLETPLPDLSKKEQFLDDCRSKFGPEYIKVVISDVEDKDSERKITDLWLAGKYWNWELLTISKAEMTLLTEYKINPLSAERRMANKLRHIYQILQEAAVENFKRESQKAESRTSQLKKVKVGIFSGSAPNDHCWINELLESDYFEDQVSAYLDFDISNKITFPKWASFGILYFKKRVPIHKLDVKDVHLIQEYRRHFGKDNVIIVMDDVEKSSDQDTFRLLESHPDKKELYHKFFLFSQQEKSSEYRTLLSSLLSIRLQATRNVPRHVTRSVTRTAEDWVFGHHYSVSTGSSMSTQRASLPPSIDHSILGIFSRTSKEYSWLEAMLKPHFTEVKSFCIIDDRLSQFMTGVSQCSLGILYYNKKSEVVMDKELDLLSKKLGKQRVWVVIDDLDDDSELVKNQFLVRHPKIQNLAKDLFLIKYGPAEQKIRDLEQKKPQFLLRMLSI